MNGIVPGDGFRLPTEAEWEYACRAGSETAFWFGEQITLEQSNVGGKETVEVKALPYNGWGLYQMHGNVWEWCRDWYGKYPSGSVIDPEGPSEGRRRVLRGGSWFNDAWVARSAQRSAVDPGDRVGRVGFRLARGQASDRQVSSADSPGQVARSGAGQGLAARGRNRP